jgi:hypothetical protein
LPKTATTHADQTLLVVMAAVAVMAAEVLNSLALPSGQIGKEGVWGYEIASQ